MKLRETLNIFNNSKNFSPFYNSYSADNVKEKFKQFFDKVNSVPLDILHQDVSNSLNIFKSDMREINDFVHSLDNKTKPKFK